MAEMATMRMKALHFWDKHGISATSEAFGVFCRTLYWWRQLLNKGLSHTVKRLWCKQRYLACLGVSTIGRMIAAAHDKMRMIPARLGSRGKALLVKKRSAKPRKPKHYRPLIGMDAIELRMGELRRYVITMIDDHSNYALVLAVPSFNSDIVNHFFSRAAGCSLSVSARSSQITEKSSQETST